MSKVSRNQKSVKTDLFFNNIGWSVFALITLACAWWLMKNQPTIPLRYTTPDTILTGMFLAVSIASVVIGVWKASYRWKFLCVAIALVWLVPFVFYAMSFAGPLFVIDFTG